MTGREDSGFPVNELFVILAQAGLPAGKAGIQNKTHWIPFFKGMTGFDCHPDRVF